MKILMKNEIGTTGDSRNGSDDGGGEAAKTFLFITQQHRNATWQYDYYYNKQNNNKIGTIVDEHNKYMLALECFSRYRIITSLYSHKSREK